MKMIATLMKVLGSILLLVALAASTTLAQEIEQDDPKLHGPSKMDAHRSQRLQNMLQAAVRHELVTLPYYDVFDWLEAEVQPGGQVVLRGEVVRPTTSSDAEKRVRRIEGVHAVTNEIKVLSVSQLDRNLRIALYRAIYNYNSPLFRYATRAMPPIHIVVENSRATLKGVVASEMESQLAYNAARHVPGLFEVKNELRIDE
jgi:osmotically-inducible protein OsmY